MNHPNRAASISSQEQVQSDDEFYEVNDLKSNVWKYFKRNKQGVCRCNRCGLLFQQLNQSTILMSLHIQRQHASQIQGINRTRQQDQQFITDFFENLIMEGYPVQKLVDSLLKLFVNYQPTFHELINRLVGKLPQARQDLKQIFARLPIDTDIDIVQSIIEDLLPSLSAGARKQLIQQHFWIYANQQQILLNFKDNGYNIITLYDGQNLISMMLITESMREMYYKYGDCLSIDLIDKVLKKKSPYGFCDYSTWFFTGQDQFLENVLFGFAIINEETDKNINFMLGNFFKNMHNILPISICIPPYLAIEQSLQKIAPSSTIIINWYHKLKFIKQILEQEIEHQSIMRSICGCFQAQSKQVYDLQMQKIMSKVADMAAIKFGVQRCREKFCVFCMPLRFIGFSIQTRKYLDLEKEVRQIFVYQRNIARLFIYVIKLDKKLNHQAPFFQKPKPNFQEANSYLDKYIQQSKQQSIQNISKTQNIPIPALAPPKLSQKIQERIQNSLKQLSMHKLQIIDPITVHVLTRKNHISKWKCYITKYKIQHDHWQCNCRFLQHTGLPCAHLIKVIQHYGGNYLAYVNPRWFIQN